MEGTTFQISNARFSLSTPVRRPHKASLQTAGRPSRVTNNDLHRSRLYSLTSCHATMAGCPNYHSFLRLSCSLGRSYGVTGRFVGFPVRVFQMVITGLQIEAVTACCHLNFRRNRLFQCVLVRTMSACRSSRIMF